MYINLVELLPFLSNILSNQGAPHAEQKEQSHAGTHKLNHYAFHHISQQFSLMWVSFELLFVGVGGGAAGCST